MKNVIKFPRRKTRRSREVCAVEFGGEYIGMIAPFKRDKFIAGIDHRRVGVFKTFDEATRALYIEHLTQKLTADIVNDVRSRVAATVDKIFEERRQAGGVA